MHKIIFFVSFLIAVPLCAQTYEVAFKKGRVEIYRNKKLTEPPVIPGDVINVFKGSLLILKSPDEVLKIMHDTVISPRKTKEGTLIDLVKGSMISKVTKKNFKIRTKGTVFGVRGTQFFVHSSQDEAWMCVNEGIVTVKKGKKSVSVPEGKGVFVGKKEVSPPESYAWTKKINWKMEKSEGDLDHKIDLKYDLLENFYD